MTNKMKRKQSPKIDPETDRLYRAVAHYVQKRGGIVLVAGGVQVQQWTGEGTMNFSVAVKCTGRKPGYKAETQEKPE